MLSCAAFSKLPQKCIIKPTIFQFRALKATGQGFGLGFFSFTDQGKLGERSLLLIKERNDIPTSVYILPSDCFQVLKISTQMSFIITVKPSICEKKQTDENNSLVTFNTVYFSCSPLISRNLFLLRQPHLFISEKGEQWQGQSDSNDVNCMRLLYARKQEDWHTMLKKL